MTVTSRSFTYRQDLGQFIKKHRQSANLTLRGLSQSSGVSASHLARVEKGTRFPSAAILRRLAEPLGFSEKDLFVLAGYLSTSSAIQKTSNSPSVKNKLDPYVKVALSRETIETQRTVLNILTILKNLASHQG